MLGRDHALSGCLAFAAAAPFLHASGTALAAGIAVTAGAATLPDLDEPGSTIARCYGFLTEAAAWIVHRVSGGHRMGTHSLLGAALVTAGAWAAVHWSGQPGGKVALGVLLALVLSAGYKALRVGGHGADLLGIASAAAMVWWHPSLHLIPWCIGIGMLAHVAGDMCTHSGCPLAYPLSRHEFALLPGPLRLTTGKLAEHWIVSPLLLAGLGWFLYRDAGHLISLHAPTARK